MQPGRPEPRPKSITFIRRCFLARRLAGHQHGLRAEGRWKAGDWIRTGDLQLGKSPWRIVVLRPADDAITRSGTTAIGSAQPLEARAPFPSAGCFSFGALVLREVDQFDTLVVINIVALASRPWANVRDCGHAIDEGGVIGQIHKAVAVAVAGGLSNQKPPASLEPPPAIAPASIVPESTKRSSSLWPCMTPQSSAVNDEMRNVSPAGPAGAIAGRRIRFSRNAAAKHSRHQPIRRSESHTHHNSRRLRNCCACRRAATRSTRFTAEVTASVEGTSQRRAFPQGEAVGNLWPRRVAAANSVHSTLNPRTHRSHQIGDPHSCCSSRRNRRGNRCGR